MGFFSKIFKGVKKVFKKIGKAVKSVFKKVGKFMGKIGIVGQIALGFIMPYALPALGAALGGLSTTLTTFGAKAGGFLGTIAKGAGQFINTAIKVGSQVGKAFTSITEAVKTTVGQVVGTTINALPGGEKFGEFLYGMTNGGIDITNMKDFGTAFQKVGEAWTNAGDTLTGFFDKTLYDSSLNQFSLDKIAADRAADRAELAAQLDETLKPGVEGLDLDISPTQGVDPELSLPKGLEINPKTFEVSSKTFDIDNAFQNANVSDFVAQRTDSLLGPTQGVNMDAILQTKPEMNITVAESIAEQTQAIANARGVTGQTDFSDFLEGPMPKTSKALELGKKAAVELADAGIEPTIGGIGKSLLSSGQEEQEYSVTYGPSVNLAPIMLPDFAQPQGGLFYGSQPTFADGPSLVDMLMNQDWNSIYKYGFYGRPAAVAGMANYVADEGMVQ